MNKTLGGATEELMGEADFIVGKAARERHPRRGQRTGSDSTEEALMNSRLIKRACIDKATSKYVSWGA